jgi:two-component system LytT family response regulator
MIRETMNGIEAKLDPDKFLRIHRSTVVHIDRIKSCTQCSAVITPWILRNGTELATEPQLPREAAGIIREPGLSRLSSLHKTLRHN